jgi:hypothetical protein
MPTSLPLLPRRLQPPMRYRLAEGAATETATGFKEEIGSADPIHHRAHWAPARDLCGPWLLGRLHAEAATPMGKATGYEKELNPPPYVRAVTWPLEWSLRPVSSGLRRVSTFGWRNQL